MANEREKGIIVYCSYDQLLNPSDLDTEKGLNASTFYRNRRAWIRVHLFISFFQFSKPATIGPDALGYYSHFIDREIARNNQVCQSSLFWFQQFYFIFLSEFHPHFSFFLLINLQFDLVPFVSFHPICSFWQSYQVVFEDMWNCWLEKPFVIHITLHYCP